MAVLTIRKIDSNLKVRLRVQAARNNRSMEEEARVILQNALSEEEETGEDLLRRIREIVEPIGGIDLPEVPREPYVSRVRFDE